MKKLSSPPQNTRAWTFRHKQTKSTIVIIAQTWFLARQEACIKLGAAPEELEMIK